MSELFMPGIDEQKPLDDLITFDKVFEPMKEDALLMSRKYDVYAMDSLGVKLNWFRKCKSEVLDMEQYEDKVYAVVDGHIVDVFDESKKAEHIDWFINCLINVDGNLIYGGGNGLIGSITHDTLLQDINEDLTIEDMCFFHDRLYAATGEELVGIDINDDYTFRLDSVDMESYDGKSIVSVEVFDGDMYAAANANMTKESYVYDMVHNTPVSMRNHYIDHFFVFRDKLYDVGSSGQVHETLSGKFVNDYGDGRRFVTVDKGLIRGHLK